MDTNVTKAHAAPIPRTPISGSSQIKAIGYDEASKTLSVEFHNGGSVYHYADVPPERHAEFMAAESKGKFFGRAIKGAFEHKKITAVSEEK